VLKRACVIGAVSLVVLWLSIGEFAALQRGYIDEYSCATDADVAWAVVSGPLNYRVSDPGWGMCITIA
jgi:hypothetical protein